MALSTAETYRVTERERETDSEQGKQEKEMMIEGQRKRQALKGFQPSLGEDSDAISLSSLPLPCLFACEDCFLSHLEADSDAFSGAAVN